VFGWYGREEGTSLGARTVEKVTTLNPPLDPVLAASRKKSFGQIKSLWDD
jgi:hypothetical protein